MGDMEMYTQRRRSRLDGRKLTKCGGDHQAGVAAADGSAMFTTAQRGRRWCTVPWRPTPENPTTRPSCHRRALQHGTVLDSDFRPDLTAAPGDWPAGQRSNPLFWSTLSSLKMREIEILREAAGTASRSPPLPSPWPMPVAPCGTCWLASSARSKTPLFDLDKAEDNYGQADLPLAFCPTRVKSLRLQMDGDLSPAEYELASGRAIKARGNPRSWWMPCNAATARQA